MIDIDGRRIDYPSNVREALIHILDLTLDYDGFNSAESLKSLIDDIISTVRLALEKLDEGKFY